MTSIRAAFCGVALAVLNAGAAFAFLPTAEAASDVQVTAIDCLLHPRKIAIQNKGDTAQDLTGWKLLSDKPNEVFDLSVAGSVGPGIQFYVFNGHLAPSAPEQSGGQWIYPWNYTPVLDENAFVLHEDGKDFIRIVDASGWPWREVSAMPCPGTTEIPPLQQPETPTPPPSSPDPGAGNTGGTDGNQETAAQSGGAQSGASQNTAAGSTAVTSGAGSTAQTGSVGGAAGGPSSGAGGLRLQVSGGSPLARQLLPLSLLGVAAGAALALLGVRMMRRSRRR